MKAELLNTCLGEFNLSEADKWSNAILVSYFQSQTLSPFSEYFEKNGTTGAQLIDLDLRTIIRFVNLVNLGDRRKGEHLIEKIKDAVKERRSKEQEKMKRRDQGTLISYSLISVFPHMD